jgi:two-component system, cell cycle response regulator
VGRVVPQVQGGRDAQEKDHLNNIIIPGLLIYCFLSGMGLFLQKNLASPYFFPWAIGFVFLVFIVSYRTVFSKDRAQGLNYFILGIIALNVLIQITGGAASPLFPLYLFLASLAALLHPTWAYLITGIILCIEASNLFVSGTTTPILLYAFASFSASLAGIALITTRVTHNIRREAKVAKDGYEKLLSDANAVDPLAGGSNVESLTEQRRQATYINVAREREGAFSSLIDMISFLVPAHTYALYLDDHDDGIFSLRGIRSQSLSLSSSPVEFMKGNGLIGICAAQSQTQYLPEMVIPSRSLGYYAQDVPIKSLLAVPIIQSELVRGVMVLDSLQRDAFPENAQNILNRFTPFFSQIIENIRKSLEMDIRARNFAALHEMSSVLSSSLEVSEVLDKLINQIRSVVPFDFCAFLLYDDDTHEVVLTALKGYDTKFIGSRFPREQSTILAHMYSQWQDRRSMRVHYDPDLGNRGREIRLFPYKELQPPIKSLFGRPLVAGDKFIGAAFLSSVRANVFTEYHRNFMDTLLNQVSMVVDNSLLHRSIREMARTDGLTGLLNHRTFMEKLSDEYRRLIRDSRPFSILLIDIDHFKKVNDDHGHPVGDIVIKRVAAVLKDIVRGSDFVARYGGEEFAVGMVDTDESGAHQTAERIRKNVDDASIILDKIIKPIKVTVSGGIASYPADTKRLEELIEFSDEALYHAKRHGRNRVSLYREMKNDA